MPIVYTDASGIDIVKEKITDTVWVCRKPHQQYVIFPLYISMKDYLNPIQTDGSDNLLFHTHVCHLYLSNKLIPIHK